MHLPDLGVKLGFRIKTILSDDIDSICEARNEPTHTQLCLLSTGNIAILDNVQVQTGVDVGPSTLIKKYNSHPLVNKGTYPKIVKYVTVTQPVVEGVVIAGDAFKYLATK